MSASTPFSQTRRRVPRKPVRFLPADRLSSSSSSARPSALQLPFSTFRCGPPGLPVAVLFPFLSNSLAHFRQFPPEQLARRPLRDFAQKLHRLRALVIGQMLTAVINQFLPACFRAVFQHDEGFDLFAV